MIWLRNNQFMYLFFSYLLKGYSVVRQLFNASCNDLVR
jgi:hypothetical protein